MNSKRPGERKNGGQRELCLQGLISRKKKKARNEHRGKGGKEEWLALGGKGRSDKCSSSEGLWDERKFRQANEKRKKENLIRNSKMRDIIRRGERSHGGGGGSIIRTYYHEQ